MVWVLRGTHYLRCPLLATAVDWSLVKTELEKQHQQSARYLPQLLRSLQANQKRILKTESYYCTYMRDDKQMLSGQGEDAIGVQERGGHLGDLGELELVRQPS